MLSPTEPRSSDALQEKHFTFRQIRRTDTGFLDIGERLCFTVAVDSSHAAAEDCLRVTVDRCTDIGLVDAWAQLIRDVYGRNLARYEPDELGDTAMSLGIQCSENLKTRALRRGYKDDRELPEDHWNLPGLIVSTRRNSLMFEVEGNRIFVMKVPYAEARVPRWDLAKQWDQGSDIRHRLAEGNSRVLGGYKTLAGGDDALFPHPGRPGRIRNYLLVWAGEVEVALTSAWLTVPALGDRPFLAKSELWSDEQPTGSSLPGRRPERGPDFDQRPPATPEIVVKPRPGAEGGRA